MKLQPHELAWVTVHDQRTESGKYMYVGELMSFPTPAKTIMVRRAPGHPGTLEEVRVADVAAVVGPRQRFVNYAHVKGFGAFPTDMLRYDNGAPGNFQLVT